MYISSIDNVHPEGGLFVCLIRFIQIQVDIADNFIYLAQYVAVDCI